MAMRHLLLTCDAVGGVWQYSTDLARALAPLGYQVTLAVMGPSPNEAARDSIAGSANISLVDSGLELDWLAADPAPVIDAERRLAEMAGDLGADLVQLHTPALVSMGRYPCPVIAVQHSCVATWWAAVHGGDMPEDFVWRTEMVARGLQHAAVAIAPSTAFAEAVRRVYGIMPFTVHNGRALPVPARKPMRDYVFTAGRLWDDGKNVRVLDEAAARISAPFLAAGPVIAPHGGALAIESLQAIGTLDEFGLAERLSERPVFASSALYEPFGLAVLEAASAGCALILSDIPTFRELWEGAATFVDTHDAKGCARAIEHMLSSRAARLDAGQRAQERAHRYIPAAMAGAMAHHYAMAEQRVAA